MRIVRLSWYRYLLQVVDLSSVVEAGVEIDCVAAYLIHPSALIDE
jgi:hypothetical protein